MKANHRFSFLYLTLIWFFCFSIVISSIGISAQTLSSGKEIRYSAPSAGSSWDEEDEGWDFKEAWIYIQFGADIFLEKVLVKGDEVFLSESLINSITNYTYDANRGRFTNHYSNDNPCKRYVYVNREKSTLTVIGGLFNSVIYETYVSTFPEYNSELYFPLVETLPLLDVLPYVENGNLVLSYPTETLAAAFEGMDLKTLRFNADTEFNSNEGAKIFVLFSPLIYDTLIGLKFTRLIPYVNAYRDYKKVFSEYLSDNKLHEKISSVMVVGHRPDPGKKETKENVNEHLSLMKEAVQEWGLTYDSFKIEYGLFDDLGDIQYFYDHCIPEPVWEAMEMADDGLSYLSAGTKLALTYINLIQDNRDMFKAVFLSDAAKSGTMSLNSKGLNKNAIVDVAKEILTVYDDKLLSNVWLKTTSALTEMGIELFTDTVEKSVSSLFLQAAFKVSVWKTALVGIAKFVGEQIMKSIFGVDEIEEAAYLSHHVFASDSGMEAYQYYLNQGMDSAEHYNNLRLSAIMSLVASKRCFEIFKMYHNPSEYKIDENEAAARKEIQSYCDTRIANIEKRLVLLYQARDSVFLADEDYYEGMSYSLYFSMDDLKIVYEPPQVNDMETLDLVYSMVIQTFEQLGMTDIRYYIAPANYGQDGVCYVIVYESATSGGQTDIFRLDVNQMSLCSLSSYTETFGTYYPKTVSLLRNPKTGEMLLKESQFLAGVYQEKYSIMSDSEYREICSCVMYEEGDAFYNVDDQPNKSFEEYSRCFERFEEVPLTRWDDKSSLEPMFIDNEEGSYGILWDYLEENYPILEKFQLDLDGDGLNERFLKLVTPAEQWFREKYKVFNFHNTQLFNIERETYKKIQYTLKNTIFYVGVHHSMQDDTFIIATGRSIDEIAEIFAKER